MLKFYYSLAPNPMKVALFLEESGLPYEAIPVDTRKGEQHAPAFTALNPGSSGLFVGAFRQTVAWCQ
jgi:GST-like protein